MKPFLLLQCCCAVVFLLEPAQVLLAEGDVQVAAFQTHLLGQTCFWAGVGFQMTLQPWVCLGLLRHTFLLKYWHGGAGGALLEPQRVDDQVLGVLLATALLFPEEAQQQPVQWEASVPQTLGIRLKTTAVYAGKLT